MGNSNIHKFMIHPMVQTISKLLLSLQALMHTSIVSFTVLIAQVSCKLCVSLRFEHLRMYCFLEYIFGAFDYLVISLLFNMIHL